METRITTDGYLFLANNVHSGSYHMWLARYLRDSREHSLVTAVNKHYHCWFGLQTGDRVTNAHPHLLSV